MRQFGNESRAERPVVLHVDHIDVAHGIGDARTQDLVRHQRIRIVRALDAVYGKAFDQAGADRSVPGRTAHDAHVVAEAREGPGVRQRHAFRTTGELRREQGGHHDDPHAADPSVPSAGVARTR